MAKIDEIKEILNSLRIGLSIVVGLIVLITGSLVSMEKSGIIDIYFWFGLFLEIVLLLVFIKIIFSIKKNTKEIGRL